MTLVTTLVIHYNDKSSIHNNDNSNKNNNLTKKSHNYYYLWNNIGKLCEKWWNVQEITQLPYLVAAPGRHSWNLRKW